ncbi:hypothetical protein [Actinomadura parmotrematis]|uniref:Lipoprotein n=1 Tax=Actinomadura parmotrematis TaxID=2864039 RepID=A0ABS7G0P1_9ACTN|nr:hypothetical protein [Actinomadura parmotrematis]MBW8486258.1 hypothetical protein [Actinomadura parmotrematis]
MAVPSVRAGLAVPLVAVAVLTACGGQDPVAEPGRTPATPATPTTPTTPTTGPSAAPTAPGELVLRWRLTGGIAGMGGPGTVPDFSLYGDGRAFAKGLEYRLKPDALQRLLDGARAAGLGTPRHIERGQVADVRVLVLTFGAARTTISQPEAENVPQTRFWKRLDPAGWATSDQAAPAKPYVAERAAVIAGDTGEEPGPAKPWPLAALGGGQQALGGLCTVYTGADARTAQRVAASREARWRSGGKVYSVRLRPLLPDERTCADAARS